MLFMILIFHANSSYIGQMHIFSSFSRPGQRTVDDLEIIYEELLHIKALSHLSTTVSEHAAVVNYINVPLVSLWEVLQQAVKSHNSTV